MSKEITDLEGNETPPQTGFLATDIRDAYPNIVLGTLRIPKYKMEVLASMVKPVRNQRKPIRVLTDISGERKDIGSLFGNQLVHLIDLLGREMIVEAWYDENTLLEGDLLFALASQ